MPDPMLKFSEPEIELGSGNCDLILMQLVLNGFSIATSTKQKKKKRKLNRVLRVLRNFAPISELSRELIKVGFLGLKLFFLGNLRRRIRF